MSKFRLMQAKSNKALFILFGSAWIPASFVLAAFSAHGVPQALGTCDDLSGIPANNAVDFAEVQSLLESNNCTNCHSSSSPAGGLSLSPPDARANLVCIPVQDSDVTGTAFRVVPGDPATSILFDSINCDNAAIGIRMPIGSEVDTIDQRIVFDWISQGANVLGDQLFVASFEDNETCN